MKEKCKEKSSSLILIIFLSEVIFIFPKESKHNDLKLNVDRRDGAYNRP